MKKSEILDKAKPILFNTEMVKAILEGRKTATRRVIKLHKGMTGRLPECGERDYLFYPGGIKRPRYKKGEYLYIRETYQECCRKREDSQTKHDKYCYKASDDEKYGCIDECGKICKWHPSIHMPKEAARIFIRVTDVYVEKLQDITEEQAKREGAEENFVIVFAKEGNKLINSAVYGFMNIWENTVSKLDIERYGWNANPWVWVYEFEKIEVEDEDH